MGWSKGQASLASAVRNSGDAAVVLVAATVEDDLVDTRSLGALGDELADLLGLGGLVTLEAAQVAAWWSGVEQLPNRTASIYLRALLLTGARREELATLTWGNVDSQWRKLTIADKVDSTRTIPLSAYMAQLLATLPKTGPFVFASTGKAGRISDARSSHAAALQEAGIEHLTFHGLRRSFSLLGEAAGAPAGAIAQIMGHKPSATAEGYRPRSVDALRPFLARIEEHILDLAGVQYDSNTVPGVLRAVV